MTRRQLKDWLEAYLEYTNNLESPEIFHFWTGVSTIAGALRKRVYIPQRHFKWYPNFFIIFVGPPGIVKKSTTMDVGKKLLKELSYIHFGPDIATWQELITSLSEARDDIPTEDPNKAANPLEVEFEPSCAMTIFSSELGNFIDPANKEQINVLTDLWDGRNDVFEKKTKTQGDDIIPNPFLNLLGCTTPAWMQDNFKGQFIGWGFSSRTILIYRDRKRKRVAYPGLDAETESDHAMRRALVADLDAMGYLAGPYALAPDAIELGKDWYDAHCDREDAVNADPSGDPYLQHFLARKQGHIHKLAMILAASRRNELVITRLDLEDAIKRVDEIETEMHKLFNRHVRIPENGTAKYLEDLLKRYGRMKEQHVYGALLRMHVTYKDISDAITLCLKAELIERISEGGAFWLNLRETDHGEDAV